VSIDRLELLTTREKQAFAALCFAKYCTINKFFHDSISELAEHLLSILVSHSLPD
jgi:hypothetical protein